MDNPYQTPNLDAQNQQTTSSISYGGTDLKISQYTIASMMKAKGWVRFLSVLGFIWFGCFSIAMFWLFFALGSFSGGSSFGGAESLILLVVIVVAVLVFILSLRLTRYASALTRLGNTLDPYEFEAATIAQLKFWRLNGILLVIVVVVSMFRLLS